MNPHSGHGHGHRCSCHGKGKIVIKPSDPLQIPLLNAFLTTRPPPPQPITPFDAAAAGHAPLVTSQQIHHQIRQPPPPEPRFLINVKPTGHVALTPPQIRQPPPRHESRIPFNVKPAGQAPKQQESPKPWEIPFNEITMNGMVLLGEGSFGRVYRGKWRNQTVAIKSFKKEAMGKEEFLREANIMRQLNGKYLVKIYGISINNDSIFIVQEYMANGNLLRFLGNKGRSLKLENLIKFAYYTAAGMQCLEAQHIMHRDLAARNVLVGTDYVLKISDFGLARVVESCLHSPRYFSVFPQRWSAPEVLQKKPYSIKCDVWSYGVLLMEIFTYGETPYSKLKEAEVVVKVKNGYRMPKPELVPQDVYEKMLMCWSTEPDKRPSFKTLSKFFAEYKVKK